MKTIMSIITTILFFAISYPNTEAQADSVKKHENAKIKKTNILNKSINKELSTSEKIIAEKEQLTSGPERIDKDEVENTKKKQKNIFEFGGGATLPISTELRKNYNPGPSISMNFYFPLTFKLFQKTIHNALSTDYYLLDGNKNLEIISIIYKNIFTHKSLPLKFSLGAGIVNAYQNHFINSFDIFYSFPNENLSLNISLKASWNSFNLKDKTMGLNIIYAINY